MWTLIKPNSLLFYIMRLLVNDPKEISQMVGQLPIYKTILGRGKLNQTTSVSFIPSFSWPH